MSRFLITGASGFIGGHLADQLAKVGHTVYCLTRRPQPQSPPVASVQWIHSDLLEPRSYEYLLPEVDFVVHCAGIINARRTQEFIETNVTASERLLEACAKAGAPRKRFLLMSSIAAMGPDHTGGLLRETDTCRPESEYGKSKLQAEAVACNLSASVPLVIIRPSFVYGRRDMRGLAFLQSFWGKTPSLAPSLIKSFSVCHVSDLIKGCLLAMNEDVPSGDVFILSDPEVYTWNSARELLREIMCEELPRISKPDDQLDGDSPGRFVFADLPAEIQQHWGCDITKAQRELGFAPRVSFRDGARDTIRWYGQKGLLPPRSDRKSTLPLGEIR